MKKYITSLLRDRGKENRLCHRHALGISLKLLMIFVWMVMGCEKEIDYPTAPIHFPGDQEYGWSTAQKNGLDFEASGHTARHFEISPLNQAQ
jgi:hypothetical protein